MTERILGLMAGIALAAGGVTVVRWSLRKLAEINRSNRGDPMNVCQKAAAETALFRHWDQMLRVVADAHLNKVVNVAPLRAIEGTRPALAPAGSRHPSLRAVRGPQ